MGTAVAMGVAPVSDQMPERLRTAGTEGSHLAFMNGVRTAVLVAGALCVVGAVPAVLGVRRTAPETAPGHG
ncbi:hypothetical protein ACFQ8C_09580 [Streptomyces sp. NPDC056503]|uniref:hypothetical protein n=1 Tax=Streptomyces sp. NPDC056503 TaxID=3345842 RepID=UPI0036794BFD